MLLYREKEEVGMGGFEQKSIEGKWVQDGDSFSLAELWYFLLTEIVAGQGSIPPSSCWSSKIGVFLLGMQGESLPVGSATDEW